MITNESAPNVPQPIDPASQIALAVLARFFDERHVRDYALAERFRVDEPSECPEQYAIAATWAQAANVTWAMLGGRPNSKPLRGHRIRIGVSELGKLIAMATAAAPNAERIDELEAHSTQLHEATDAMHKVWPDDIAWRGSLAEWIEAFAARSPANECSDAERTQYEVTIERIQGVTVKAHQALDKYGIQAWGDDHQLELHERIELTIAQQQKRIAELETSTKQAWREREYFQSRASEDPTKALVVRLESDRDAARTEILVLQARIDELSKVPVADDQTPGEVPILSMQGCEPRLVSLEMLASAEIDARAVLRVFGNGAAALQRVRDTIEKTRIDSFAAKQETLVQCTANAAYLYAIKVINAELAFAGCVASDPRDRTSGPMMIQPGVLIHLFDIREEPIDSHMLAEAKKLVLAGYRFDERADNVIIPEESQRCLHCGGWHHDPVYKLTQEQARVFWAAFVQIKSERHGEEL